MPSPLQSNVSKDIATGVVATLGIFGLWAIMPVMGLVFSIFIPLPILFYRIKLGRHHSIFIPVVVMAMIGLISGGPTTDLFFFSAFIALGFFLGEMIEKSLPVEMVVVAACAGVIGIGVGILLMYSVIAHKGIVELISDHVKTSLELSLALYKSFEMPQETIDAISGSLDRIQYVMVRLLPSMATASILFVAWINLIAGRSLVTRSGLTFPDYGRLNRWRAPEGLVWGMIASIAILVLMSSTGFRLLGISGLLVMMVIYFMQGIAIVSFFLEKNKLSRAVRVLVYSLIAFQQILVLIVVSIGFFDVWIDFRKLSPNRREPDPSDRDSV
ncbi:YybS family protein [Desulfosarcina sp. OttesenSCG-928-A07]|nr:YybS family protein [Desulfosarcina sp. OttesenSCG-928-A07]